ncbi:MAG: capsule assembly Wzi family protein [Ignavibacteriota bacterium]
MFKKIFLFLALNYLAAAQVVYEPLHRDVYSFLSRLSQKSVIVFDDQIRPVSRKYIAEKLLETSSKSAQLTSLEKEELEFYNKDFKFEFDINSKTKIDSSQLTIIGYDAGDRLRLFSFRDNLFSINVSPIVGMIIGSRDNEKLAHVWNGVYTYGYIDKYLGFSFDFRDNTELGKTIDKHKDFTPVTGVEGRTNGNIVNYPDNKTEYSEINAVLATDWGWGSFSVGKGFHEWGYGESGLLVLSQKPPSYGFINLDIRPVDWLRFNYMHGWLSSDVPDSNSYFYNTAGTISFSFKDKFIATHSIIVTPLTGLDLSVGESIIYDDKLEFLYLIPIMFFRLADHQLSNQENAAGGNAQFFFAASSKGQIKNTHLYATLFIDELTLSGLFDSYKQRNQLGFTLGGSVTDLPIENLTTTIEYTKIYPFVYHHYIQTKDYRSDNYILGHWMGHNADQIYASLNYRFMRGLQATVFGQYIRKGEDGNVQQQYNIQPQPPFLFGLRKDYTYLGAEIKYEYTHELFAKLSFQTTNSSIQQNDFSFVDARLNEFYFSIYYGL